MLLERSQIGKKEELLDLISRVDQKETPVLTMLPKERGFRNMLYSWQADDFEEPEDLAFEDGEDASTFDNPVPNRALLSTYQAKFLDTAMVSDLAENVSDVAGLPQGENANAIMKKLEKLKRCIESAICGDQEHQAGAGGVPYKIRGLGLWIQATAQATLPVNANYRPPAASITTTATASITTTIIDDLLQSSFEQTGKRSHFMFIVGPTLKRQFTSFATRIESGASSASRIRAYTSNWEGALDQVVDSYKADFGIVDLHSTLFNARTAFGGAAAEAERNLRGYGLIMDLLALSRKRAPRVKELEDRGGGPRFLVDAVFGTLVKNPKPLIKIASTAAA